MKHKGNIFWFVDRDVYRGTSADDESTSGLVIFQEVLTQAWLLMHRVPLIFAQRPIAYRSGRQKLMMVLTWQLQSRLDSMEQNRLLVSLMSPHVHAHTHMQRTDSVEAACCSGHDSSDFRFLVSRWEESAAAERGSADRHYGALQAQSYLYSAYRFTLTHHGAEASIKSVAAHRSKKTICLCFVSVWSPMKKQIHHLHMAVVCKTNHPPLSFFKNKKKIPFFGVINPFSSTLPQ